MSQLVKKTIDANYNSFDLTDIMRTFSGDNSLDVGSLIGQVTSGKNQFGNIGGMPGGLFGKE